MAIFNGYVSLPEGNIFTRIQLDLLRVNELRRRVLSQSMVDDRLGPVITIFRWKRYDATTSLWLQYLTVNQRILWDIVGILWHR